MKIQSQLPEMIPEETEGQLQYMNAVIMFKVIHSRGIINEKELHTNARYQHNQADNGHWYHICPSW